MAMSSAGSHRPGVYEELADIHSYEQVTFSQADEDGVASSVRDAFGSDTLASGWRAVSKRAALALVGVLAVACLVLAAAIAFTTPNHLAAGQGASTEAAPLGAPLGQLNLLPRDAAAAVNINISPKEKHTWARKRSATCAEVKSLSYSAALERCIDAALEDPDCARPPSVSFQSSGSGNCFCSTGSPCKISDSTWLDLYMGLKRVEADAGNASKWGFGKSKACEIERDTDYPGNDLGHVENVTSATRCCAVCRQDARCLAWTWARDTCYMKGGLPRQRITKLRTEGVTSGQTHQVDKPDSPVEAAFAEKGVSLFCFSLFRPYSEEAKLLATQYNKQASLFQCDEYQTFSNLWSEVVPGVWSTAINSTLNAPLGGYWMTALNVPIFLELWRVIFKERRYDYHDWSVKVDPDAVFFPSRLVRVLRHHEEKPNGVYLNNCKYGFHGPLEVFSRNALRRYARGAERCVEELTNPSWGEDYFTDVCLGRVLGVDRADELGIMIEVGCDPPYGWRSCSDDSVAVFHPFKTPGEYEGCLGGAGIGSFVY